MPSPIRKVRTALARSTEELIAGDGAGVVGMTHHLHGQGRIRLEEVGETRRASLPPRRCFDGGAVGGEQHGDVAVLPYAPRPRFRRRGWTGRWGLSATSCTAPVTGLFWAGISGCAPVIGPGPMTSTAQAPWSARSCRRTWPTAARAPRTTPASRTDRPRVRRAGRGLRQAVSVKVRRSRTRTAACRNRQCYRPRCRSGHEAAEQEGVAFPVPPSRFSMLEKRMPPAASALPASLPVTVHSLHRIDDFQRVAATQSE